jgi:glycerol-3-phosphate dehydrogenase
VSTIFYRTRCTIKRDFSEINQKQYDLIIIGGGIVGTGIARDASLRGLKTLVVEKEDFAYGTTSRSTRLIHGGLRYLRQFEFKLVIQDLHEREVLLHIAPHLVSKLEFAIPLLKSEPMYRLTLPIGLLLYDILARGKSLPSRQHLSQKKTLELEPALKDVPGLVGSFLYHDCQAGNMERLCMENAIGASQKGSMLLNHTQATDFLVEEGSIKGIHLQDCLTGQKYTARARLTINAGGPWANEVWNKLNMGQPFKLRRTKGVHLLTRKISDHALVLFAKSDGRLFFVIPWNNRSLIGTTDTDYKGDPDKVGAEKSDVEYLIKETQHYFPKFGVDDVYYTMAGLRPLASRGEKNESNTSRAHQMIDHEKSDNVKGLISILGGKITAYRAIAEEATDLACKKFKLEVPCITEQTPLPGAPKVSERDIDALAQKEKLAVETVAYLASIYGSRLYDVVELTHKDKSLAKPISAGQLDIRAQILHAVTQEQALSVGDFMLRRSLLGLSPSRGKEAAAAVASDMAPLLGWNDKEKQKQVSDYLNFLAIGQSYR